MAIISVTTNSRNTSLTGTREIVSKAQVITWSFALALEAVVIVVGNLLTIVLFASNKKLRTKKSLYLVLNMAFADLVLGGVCLPTSVYVLGTRNWLSQELTSPTSFLKIVRYGFLASLTHYRYFDICREILCHILAIEAPKTYNASIQAVYFDGVDCSNSFSYGLSSAILHPSSCVYVRIFLRFVSSSHNLWF